MKTCFKKNKVKIKDFEKDVGSFIEKANVITDAKYDQFSLCCCDE